MRCFILILLSSIIISSCNKTEKINVELNEDETSWFPYNSSDTLVFESEELQIVTNC